MLRRMRVLEEATAALAPVRILDDLPLFLGNAVAADSHHVLRHLGITHILNATEVSVTMCRMRGGSWAAGKERGLVPPLLCGVKY